MVRTTPSRNRLKSRPSLPLMQVPHPNPCPPHLPLLGRSPASRFHTFCKLLQPRRRGIPTNIWPRHNSPRFSHSAAAAADECSDGDVGGNLIDIMPKREDGFGILNLMEVRGVRANWNTYALLLDGCQSSGFLEDAKRIHGRILKLGFDAEDILCAQLVNVYTVHGDVCGAVKMFDGMCDIGMVLYKSIVSCFLSRGQIQSALAVCSRMLKECEEPDHAVFANVLRACSGFNISFCSIQQIHAKLIRCGLGANSLFGNPLIDLYAKIGCIRSTKFVFEELDFRDIVSWVAMVSGLTQNGLGEEALLLYVEMHQLGVIPTPYVFSSVLSASTKCEFFEFGKQLHAQVFKQGLHSETYVGNALITLYSRCGNLISAEQIFDTMTCHDRVTYNSLISGHAQCGSSDSAIQLFRKMQLSYFKPDPVTVASLLSACASTGAVRKGKQLHTYAVKAGHTSDIIIEGSLLDFYVKCADIETAREFFNNTRRDNVVLWNVMLVAYGQMGNLRESFELFYEMQVADMKPNQYTYPSILRTCTLLGALDLGEQIHTLVIKTQFDLNVYVSSVLVDMYSKCGRLETARTILERVKEKDVVSWTAMIAGYAQNECCVEALRTFEEMQIQGIKSDHIGLASALSACAGIQAIEQGLQIHAQAVVSGYSVDTSIGNALVNLYARCGRLKYAYSTFEAIADKDEISWNGLISGFAQSGHCEEALEVFARMSQAGLRANLYTFGSVVSAAANMADVKLGKLFHARMIKTGYEPEVEAGNALITLYSKCGSIEDARMEFSGMSIRNEVSWNAMITGYSQHGCGREALKLFEQMKIEGLRPNHVTFVGVLAACSHVGLVKEGLDYFDSMSVEHGIVSKPEHYACVVDILGRAGQLQRAREFIEDMPIDPDGMVWRTLLSACTVHKNIELGEFAAQHLLELEPYDSATYVLLSNIYAVSRKWDCRDRVRQMMKDRGVKKEPGRSWIELKNSVHAFFVGDRLHPLANEIYEYLEILNERVVEIGYKQDKDGFLHELRLEQKDPSVYIHSEKLAVAFGLISLSPEIPIRVIKNLRMCNDCHNWMKFVSRIANHTIIVRDAYRFHHFEGGFCSCRDYW